MFIRRVPSSFSDSPLTVSTFRPSVLSGFAQCDVVSNDEGSGLFLKGIEVLTKVSV
jgi:hypothetical protein